MKLPRGTWERRGSVVTTYGIREFKARASEILRTLADGEEVIITRRGKPCGKLIAMPPPGREKGSVKTLMGAFKGILPEATYEDFQEVNEMWARRLLTFENDDAE